MLTELTVINSQLATMGQAPLTSLTRPHRLASSGIARLRRASAALHAQCWWWNTEYHEVTPTAVTGLITGQLPVNTLAVAFPQPLVLSLRKDATGAPYLYDLAEGEIYLSRVMVRCSLEIPFADLPQAPQQYLHDLAVWDFQKDYDGDEKRSRELKESLAGSYALMHAEHTRTVRLNMRALPSVATKIVWARGSRPVIR